MLFSNVYVIGRNIWACIFIDFIKQSYTWISQHLEQLWRLLCARQAGSLPKRVDPAAHE